MSCEEGNSSNSAKDGANENGPKPAEASHTIQDLSKELAKLGLTKSAPRTLEESEKKEYLFWSTQPVPKLNETILENEPIEPDKPISEIRSEPYTLPDGFYWDTLDLTNADQLKEVYVLLTENYVEDDDNMFRFDYSPEFLQWAIQPPGWLTDWHVGVRGGKNKKLFCFISAVPCTMHIHDKERRLVEINFLCVHKRLRNKRVAPVLIREITRRVNLRGIFQAVYTAGVMLPKPITTCRYWHRSLNPKKLIECRFSSLARNMTMQRTIKLYRLPGQPLLPGFQPLQEKHCPQAFQLLSEYLSKFKVYPVFTLEEFKYWFLPRTDVIYSYVVENDGEVTDFCSFYALPSSVIQHPVHKTLRAGYSFYNVAKGHSWKELMKDALIEAKNRDFDVFNALNLMDNKNFLEELKFGIGDGNLHYYIYNWRCPSIKPEEIALVLQ